MALVAVATVGVRPERPILAQQVVLAAITTGVPVAARLSALMLPVMQELTAAEARAAVVLMVLERVGLAALAATALNGMQVTDQVPVVVKQEQLSRPVASAMVDREAYTAVAEVLLVQELTTVRGLAE